MNSWTCEWGSKLWCVSNFFFTIPILHFDWRFAIALKNGSNNFALKWFASALSSSFSFSRDQKFWWDMIYLAKTKFLLASLLATGICLPAARPDKTCCSHVALHALHASGCIVRLTYLWHLRWPVQKKARNLIWVTPFSSTNFHSRKVW